MTIPYLLICLILSVMQRALHVSSSFYELRRKVFIVSCAFVVHTFRTTTRKDAGNQMNALSQLMSRSQGEHNITSEDG